MHQAVKIISTDSECASSCIINSLHAPAESRLADIEGRLRHTNVLIGTLVNHNDISDEMASILMCIGENVNGARLIAEQSGLGL